MAVNTRQIKSGIWAADIALAAVGIFLLVNAGQHLLGRPSLEPAPLVDSTPAGNSISRPATRPKVRPSGEYQNLRMSKLFGALSSSNVAPKKVVEEDIPETTLELELLGLVVHDGAEPGFAVIRDKKKRTEDTYVAGDFIVGDAKVEEIRPTEVVISRAGRRETLSLDFRADDPGKTGFFPRGGGRAPAFPTPKSSRGASGEPVRVVNDNLRYINKASLMQQVSRNLTSLIDQFRTSPNIVDGKPSGIGIDQIGSDPISSKAGFKQGDVVKSINGVRVNSTDDMLEQGERLKDAPEIRVVVERDGRHRTLVYKIR